MRVLFLDGYNLMHRARYGFITGEFNVIYNFFRGLRPLIEKFNPDKVYFVLEGQPKRRMEILPEYKANRRVGLTPEKESELRDFREQRGTIETIMKLFPVETVYHPEYECDDVIAALALNEHADDECIIISNDTDFIQMYGLGKNVSIYSPVKKEFLMPTEYDYVSWKALVGDSSDNISGVPRIGKKTAVKILETKETLNEWVSKNPDKAVIYNRNLDLIRFHDLSDEMDNMYRINDATSFDTVKDLFNAMEFHSITKEETWTKYVNTFSRLE